MPVIRKTVTLLALIELAAILLVPLVVPKSIYLEKYLPERAIESTNEFLNGGTYLKPDKATGWRNRPSVEKETWDIDRYGSRSTHPATVQPKKPVRVMFLGSSMINGGAGVTNQQTVSAFVEDDRIETLNFGTMLYGLDQSLLAYQSRLNRFSPDIVVFGLDSDPLAPLKSMYVPFRSPREVYVPFLKPRFELKDGALDRVSAPPDLLGSILSRDSAFYELIRQHDGYYSRFHHFVHFEQTPIASSLYYAVKKIQSLKYYMEIDPTGRELLHRLMDRASHRLREDGVDVVFLFMPSKGQIERTGLKGRFPNRYVALMEGFRSRGLPVIDARAALISSGKPMSRLYSPDNIHFSAEGNRVVGAAVRAHIRETFLREQGNGAKPASHENG